MRLKYVEFTHPVVNPKDPHGMRRAGYSAESVAAVARETVSAVDIERDPATGVVSLSSRTSPPVVYRSSVPCCWLEWPLEVAPLPATAAPKAVK